jgi:peptidoglycan/LPS O-acetylase OafA/YrhL
MNHLSPWFALIIFIELFLIIRFLPISITHSSSDSHTNSIDGLRGFLAFSVFIHHSSIWYTFLKSGYWVEPESRLFSHLGQTTVVLFFMITGFLFFSKILENSKNPIDWLRLYVSRALRILPLYFVILIVAFIVIVLIRYSGLIQPMQPPWSEKSLFGLFTSGVTWTLSYEWKFYFLLPLLAFAIIQVSWRWLLFSIIMLVVSGAVKSIDINLFSFAGGIIAAFLAKSVVWRRLACSKLGSFFALVALLIVVGIFDTAYSLIPLILLILFFSLVANGSDFWGFLIAPAHKSLGHLTYSIYLLHGPLLFFVFRFVVGFENSQELGIFQYWGLIFLLTPFLIMISVLTFQFIELPFMRKVQVYTLKIRNFKQSLM